MGIAPHQPAGGAPRIGIDQQLVGIEAVAMFRLIGAVNAITVELTGADVVEITVPDIFGALGQFNAFEFASALAVEQAQFDLLRVGGEQRKIGSPAVPVRTEA